MAMPFSDPLPRFWGAVTKTSNCWIWRGGVSKNGYGYFEVRGRQTRVHRFSYEIHRGKIPDGLFVCHSCDNRLCVNPEHLWLGTHESNMRDMVKKGRTRPGNTPHGRKLSFTIAHEIRQMFIAGSTRKELMIRFKISRRALWAILKNRSWPK